MPHYSPLIGTIVAALVLAFILGAVANRLRLSPLVGYLLAGVVIGPATPGYVADIGLAADLAEIGVILLMFGVGLHFSLRDLLAVKAIAIPGALGQIGIATLLGMGLSGSLGWSPGAGLVFGLALSVASTVVLLRALQERHLLETTKGHIAVGWLIVEDLVMVLVLVLLPVVAGILNDTGIAGGTAPASWTDILLKLGATLVSVAAFVAFMLIVGRRTIPWALHRIAGTGSRELFTLAVLAVALGIAFGSAMIFGVSFALGAFFAGMVLAESELSHRAAEDSLPLRDAFAVLFFVSVGMLFDPAILVEMPLAVIATLLIIVVGKSLAAYLIVRGFGHSSATALTISASLAQIGEFSFILATLGTSLGLLPEAGQDLILAGAILSILVNPVFFIAVDRWQARIALATPVIGTPSATPLETPGTAPAQLPSGQALPTSALTDHAIVVGYGLVGRHLVASLRTAARPFLVIDDRQDMMAKLRSEGIEALCGNAADSEVLDAANILKANWLLVAIPNVFEAGQIIEKAHKLKPQLVVVARAESEAEAQHLAEHGADKVIIGRRELAQGMIAQTLAGATLQSAEAGGRATAL